jgi:hypothetical protein
MSPYFNALAESPLSKKELKWVSFQPLLKEHGYELRPRYDPEFEPASGSVEVDSFTVR